MGVSPLVSAASTVRTVLFAQEDESFFQSWTFIILMAVLLCGLIGVFLYIRNKQAEDD